MPEKCQKNANLVEKMEIVKELDKGERLNDLALFYGVERATIYDIKKNRDKSKGFVKETAKAVTGNVENG
ncbi:hypothetical protein PR048_000766 [Dryococelus australis]|uniref:HTH psq-type domain-containing protein n=1 Tax=Dryococelus australis TaxID=614101 RepID=A0ABQ9IGS8_9NEOP|nr:hypothetical protein PR048_000766 [Dryococelus australis]